MIVKTYSLSHLEDDALLSALSRLIARDRSATAAILAHIAEVDARKLYLPAGYASMFAYCVEELRLSEDAANKRIRVARLAREYPQILSAIEGGELHLSAVVQLGTYLTPERADGLLRSASGKSRSEIEELLASRFPTSESLPMIESIPAEVVSSLPAPGPVDLPHAHHTRLTSSVIAPKPQMKPIAPRRYTFQVMLDQETRDLLEHARDLLGHSVPGGDLNAVVARLVRLGVGVLEKQRFASTDKPRPSRASADPRHIPAAVKRHVWSRDRGRCTFESESGHRCHERRRLEFDHVVPVARGGLATPDNLRLRCRAHNQYEAERAFGVMFMKGKRETAKEDAQRHSREGVEEVIPWLRQLGLKRDEAIRAAELCAGIPGATLEERVKRALTGWVPRGTVRVPAPMSAP